MEIRVRGMREFGAVGVVLAGMVFGSFAAVVVTAPSAYAQVSQIVVEGNRRVEADTIRSYFRPGPGERLDAAKIDSALKALYGTGLFQDVRINQAGGRLVVTVVENPVINRIAFEGNKKAKDEQILSEIQSKARGTFSRATVQSDVSRIVEIYQRTGRYDVRVEPKIIELANNRVDLVFEINEGAKTGVAKIAFVGNRAYSDWRLKDVIKTGQTNWLSFLKSNDIFDPDRIEADRDLLRRFYLRHGFADVRIVSATAEYEPAKKGFVITFTIEEGDQYKFGAVDVQSNVRAIPGPSLIDRARAKPGNVYNADYIEKSVEDLSIEVSKRGYPFAVVRPRGDRDPAAKRINVVFTVEEGPHVYIERINIRGNTRTRDYVIRREFDIVEGDAYNRALVERAERRIKNLNYFKTVKFTQEPGSAPDRIIVNVDVEEQSTGEFSVAGGYSTSDGLMGEVSIGERNLLGTGIVARAAVQYGQKTRGFNVSFVEPYLLGNRMSLGLDIFAKEQTSSSYTSYLSKTYGAGLRLGIPVTDNLVFSPRYSIYRQEITLPDAYKNCNNINPDGVNTFPTVANTFGIATSCYSDGEASLPVKMELAQGPVLVSLVGYGLTYNTLDSNKNPTSGLLLELKQDLAGVGGDVNFLKSTFDGRYYQEILPDFVGLFRVQAGHATGWGDKDLRMLDHFQGGPNLVRGFQSAGFGPRDLTSGTTNDSLGGSMYWATSFEVQTPLFLAPKDFGMKLAAFVDAGSVWDYQGPTAWTQTGETLDLQGTNAHAIRAAAGVGLIWDSPFGPLRFDVAYPLAKESYDKTQIFRFGGGTKF